MKRKASDRAAVKKSKKAVKDPNKPKRPASAFFVFMYVSILQSLTLKTI